MRLGMVMYSGVDYAAILHQAEEEADVIIWDGGNNDLPFYAPDIFITVVDPLRPGHELRYHPGETNLRMADVVVVNKVDTADIKAVGEVIANIEAVNPRARIIRAASPVELRRTSPRWSAPGPRRRRRPDADARRDAGWRRGRGDRAAHSSSSIRDHSQSGRSRRSRKVPGGRLSAGHGVLAEQLHELETINAARTTG